MTKTKDVQEQVEEILQEQIALLRRRAKECARQFNHQVYDDLTAQYLVLEAKLKVLVAPNPVHKERIIAKSAILGAPYDFEKTPPNQEDLYETFRRPLQPETKMESSGQDSNVSRLPETTSVGGSGNSGTSQVLNWTRLRQHNS